MQQVIFFITYIARIKIFYSETLKGDHKYYCETCCSKQEANKSLEIRSFPSILALHLKRFRFDDAARNTNMTKLCYRYVSNKYSKLNFSKYFILLNPLKIFSVWYFLANCVFLLQYVKMENLFYILLML